MAEGKPQELVGKSNNEVLFGSVDVVKGTSKKKTYYAILSSASQSGVARLELYDSIKQSRTLQPLIMLIGQDIVKVEKVEYKGKKNSFLISTKEHHYTFIVKDVFTCSTWVQNIQKTLLGGAHGGMASQGKTVTKNDDINEYFDGVSPQYAEFIVKVTEESQDRMGVRGNVRLVVESDTITVSTIPGKMIVQWTIKHMRRFGFEEKGIFYVEAGRWSKLGEGTFKFVTSQAESIIAAIDKAKTIMRVDNSTASPTHWQCNNSPPKQTGKTVPKPTVSCDVYEELDIPAIVNIMPNELQEASAPETLHQKQQPTYQPQRQIYDEPEIRNNAWKSNGYDDSDMYDSAVYPMAAQGHQPESQEEEDHYWKGTPSSAQAEPIYAVVTKKSKIKNPVQ